MKPPLASAMAGAGLAALLFGFAVPAGASSPDAIGWWTSVPAPPTTLTSPAPVDGAPPAALAPGPGQIEVAANASGATSVAAVRFSIPGGAAPVSVSFEVAGTSGQTAIVLACPAAETWTPAEGGPMADAPTAACADHQVAASPGVDGSIAFPIDATFASGDEIDLVLLPGATDVAGQAVTPTFSIILGAPNLHITPADTTDSTAVLPTVPRAAGDPPTGSGASSDPGSSFTPVNTANSAGAAGVSDTTAAGTGSASTDAAFADNAGPTIMPAAGVALGPARRVARQVHRAGRDGAAYLGLVMFPIAGAAAIWAFNTRTPGLRGIGPFARPAPVAADGLGAVAAPTEGGIARFRRRRSEPFVPLR